jgi:hypothetical protein
MSNEKRIYREDISNNFTWSKDVSFLMLLREVGVYGRLEVMAWNDRYASLSMLAIYPRTYVCAMVGCITTGRFNRIRRIQLASPIGSRETKGSSVAEVPAQRLPPLYTCLGLQPAPLNPKDSSISPSSTHPTFPRFPAHANDAAGRRQSGPASPPATKFAVCRPFSPLILLTPCSSPQFRLRLTLPQSEIYITWRHHRREG